MRRRDKFFARMLLLSTMLVMVAVTIIAVAVYSYSSRQIKSSMAEVSIKSLNQIESFADTYVFRSVEIFAVQNFVSVQPDSSIAKIYGDGELGSSFLYDYYSRLSSMTNADSFVESVHIYVPHRNIIVSSDGISYLDDGSKPTRFTEEKKEQFERALSGEKWIYTYTNSNGENVITLLIKYSPYAAAIPRAIIAVDIKEENIQSAFDNIASDTSANVAIINENGKMISNSDKSLLFEDISDKKYIRQILETDEESGYFISRVNGRKMLVSFFKSRYNDWSYISTRDIDVVFVTNKFILSFTAIIYILVIIVGVIGSYLISKNYYTPIRNLADFVSPVTGSSKTDDAYSFLSREIYGLGDDIKKYKKLKNDILPIAKNNFAYELTHNKGLSKEYLQRQYEILGMADGEYSAFTALSCCFFDDDSDTGAYFEYSFVEYLYSLNNESRMVLCFGGAKFMTIVICAYSEETLGIIPFVNDVKSALERLRYMNFNIFVGETVYDITKVADCYERLHNMEKYSFVYSGPHVLYYNELDARERSVSALGHEALFDALGKHMDSNNTNETVMCVSQIMNTLKNGSFSYDYIQEFLMLLLEFLSGYMKEHGIATAELVKDKETLYEEYKTAATLDQIMGFIQDLCCLLYTSRCV